MNNFIPLQNGCFTELCQRYQEVDCGRISAWNGSKSNEKNIENTILLKRLLLGAGFSVTTVESQYFDFVFCGTPEDKHRWICPPPYKKQFFIAYSFLVFDCQNSGRLRELSVRLGKFFEQKYITCHNVQKNQFFIIQTPRNKKNLTGRRTTELDAANFINNADFLANEPLHKEMKKEEIINTFHEYDDMLCHYTLPYQQFYVQEFKRWQH